jgi:AraC-like DNA-binding protein
MNTTIKLKEGFKDQIQYVIPQSILARIKGHPLLHPLMMTDIGWYPHARYHYRERHDGAREHILILCVAGTGWYHINGQEYQVRENNAFLIPDGCAHSYGAAEETPWSIHWVHFIGPVGDYWAHQVQDYGYNLLVDRQTAGKVADLFQTCYQSLAEGFSEQRLIYCVQVLHHLLGCLFFHNRQFLPGTTAKRLQSVEATRQYLIENVNCALRLADMANYAGLSVAHFSHLFKLHTGYSPVDYFIHAKIQHACFLLDTTSLSIREVGLHVGYEDPYYFSRIFKQKTGMGPSEYKASLAR